MTAIGARSSSSSGAALVIGASGSIGAALRDEIARLQDLDPAHLMHAFAINAVGPAMLMKHYLSLLPWRTFNP